MSERSSAETSRELGAVNVPMTGDPEGDVEPGLQSTTVTHNQGDEERRQRIAEAAYRRAELRGFTPGHELEDWLVAEREVDAKALEEQ